MGDARPQEQEVKAVPAQKFLHRNPVLLKQLNVLIFPVILHVTCSQNMILSLFIIVPVPFSQFQALRVTNIISLHKKFSKIMSHPSPFE